MNTSSLSKYLSSACVLVASIALGACSGSASPPSGSATDGVENGNGHPNGGGNPDDHGDVVTHPGATCGAAQTKLASSEKPITAIALDDNFVYYSVQSAGIFRVAKTGGAPLKVAKTTGTFPPRAIAVDGTNVYFDDGRAVMRAEKSGAHDPTKLVDVESFGTMVLDQDALYITDKGPILSEREDKPAAGRLLRVTVAGDADPIELAKGQREPSELVTDIDAVYWFNRGAQSADYKSKHNGALMRVAKTGGPARLLFDEDNAKAGRRGFGAIFADGTSLYYESVYVADKLSDSEAGLYRLAKDGSGQPEKFSTEAILSGAGAFLDGDSFYAAAGGYIATFPKTGGDVTKITCFADASSGAIQLVGDKSQLYFIRRASPGSEIASVPR